MQKPLTTVVRCVVVGFCLLLPAAQCLAADAKPLKVLVTHGGHGFEQKPFFAVFDGMDGVEYDVAKLPDDAALLTPDLADKYDAIVMYDMVGAITPEQQQQFDTLLKKGIGVVSLHHNIGAHRNWPAYRDIVGGAWIFQPQEIGDVQYAKSTYSHGEDMRVQPSAVEHPITAGIEPFTIHDETYGGLYHADDVTVLLTTDHPKNDKAIAWVTDYGKSRIFYLQLGHDHLAYENPLFGKLILRGIKWVAE